MFTKAIIKKIPEPGSNIFTVEIPTMEDNTGTEALFEALLCSDPSSYNSYSVGDAVYVTFEDNRLNDCVIVGKLYTTQNETPTSYSLINDLKVTGNVELPSSTKIGNYTADDFTNLYNSISNSKTIIKKIDDNCYWFILDKNNWESIESSETTKYSRYVLASKEIEGVKTDVRPELYLITGEENPTWDIVVDPEDTNVPYKTQIKYRAWCTTLTTYPGKIELLAMQSPADNITLEVKGINLEA